MKIKSVSGADFSQYGFIVQGYDFTDLLATLGKNTEKPANAVIYSPSNPVFEALPIFHELQDGLYGGMPIEIGYCNGNNHQLGCLEYHRGSELNVAGNDVILLLAPLQKLEDGKLDTCHVEAFSVPAGTAVMLYETTLHYAPCNGTECDGFRVIVVLPRDTNTKKPNTPIKNNEDRLLWARNKWLIAHADATEARQGAFVGLIGENILI